MLPALAALLCLWLLPGLALVAAPWPAVPLLSVAFWLTSWGLTDLAGLSREAALRSTLLLYGLLVLLRLPRLSPRPRPSVATLAVVLTGLLGLAGAALAPLPQGPDAPRLALAARLLVARDGWPATQMPFWPERDFEAPPGLALLAADVSLVSGAPVTTALLLVGLAARGLLGCACLLAARRLGSPASAWPAVALLPWLLHATLPLATGPIELALALGLSGWALLARGTSRAPAAAAGLLLAAAVAAEARPGVALVLAATASLALSWYRESQAVRELLAARSAVALTFLAAGSLALRHGAALGLLGKEVVVAIGIVALIGSSVHRQWPRAGALLLLPVALAGAVRVTTAARDSELDQDDLAALGWLRSQGSATDRVCVSDPVRAAWLPSLAERRPAGPAERCRYRYVRAPEVAPGPPAFRAGAVQVVEIP